MGNVIADAANLGTSRYQSNPAPPPSSTNLQDPYTGSNAGASASTSNNSPLPIKGPYLTFIQANVPAMLDKLRQLNGGAKHPLDNTQLGSIERLGKYVMESNPAAEVDVSDLSVLLHALRTWPKSDIFPCEFAVVIMHTSRILLTKISARLAQSSRFAFWSCCFE